MTEERVTNQYVVALNNRPVDLDSLDVLDIWADGMENHDNEIVFYRIARTSAKKKVLGIIPHSVVNLKIEIVAVFPCDCVLFAFEVSDGDYGGIDPRLAR